MNTNTTRNYYTQPTGDPFADTGGFVIEQLWALPHLQGKNIIELIEYIAKVYINRWNAKINAFFLNSTITQPSFKGEQKLKETLKYYRSVLEGTAAYEMGYCRILGIKTKLFFGGRNNHILSGSGTFINFHHAFQKGVMLSKEILIRMFFIPFGAQQLSDKVAIISSNNEEVVRSFVKKNVLDNISRISTKIGEGVLKSKYNNPASNLFEFVHHLLVEQDTIMEEEEDVEINLYHFTNFGAAPEVILYNFSSPLFSFYKKMLHRTVAADWTKFVRGHYYNSKYKGTAYDSKTELYVSEKKKQSIVFDEYRTWVNWIYQALLLKQNILPAILKWNKQHFFDFKIVRIYQNRIKNMDQKTLDKIEALANHIISDENKLKKRITVLNQAEKVMDIRRFILELIKENHANQRKEVLMTLGDYVNYLFPDGTSAKEIRDLLLIALYQKMHENEIFFASEKETNSAPKN